MAVAEAERAGVCTDGGRYARHEHRRFAGEDPLLSEDRFEGGAGERVVAPLRDHRLGRQRSDFGDDFNILGAFQEHRLAPEDGNFECLRCADGLDEDNGHASRAGLGQQRDVAFDHVEGALVAALAEVVLHIDDDECALRRVEGKFLRLRRLESDRDLFWEWRPSHCGDLLCWLLVTALRVAAMFRARYSRVKNVL